MRKSVIVLAAVLVAALAVVGVWWYLSRPAYPWLFKGAYAVYEGETVILFVPAKVTARLEVSDLNATHVKFFLYFKGETPFGSNETTSTYWVNIKEPAPQQNLTRTYEREEYVEGLGLRKCVVYEYAESGGGMLMYVDKEVMWPVKIVLKYDNPPITLTLTLKETNIPGLKT